eukprot:TRINITY_DN1992_c0_g1_i2.p1 TRINITY_DN1992_c0_g1~~TRINITY_DN1992_c0_g1_i2.p1  ORF type:complete len:1641 (-),score=240.44 TRINITY_DN1992_c0_g1_i2:165-5087(-)
MKTAAVLLCTVLVLFFHPTTTVEAGSAHQLAPLWHEKIPQKIDLFSLSLKDEGHQKLFSTNGQHDLNTARVKKSKKQSLTQDQKPHTAQMFGQDIILVKGNELKFGLRTLLSLTSRHFNIKNNFGTVWKVSRIISTNPSFYAPTANLDIKPDEILSIVVTFWPSSLGPVSGDLIIISNIEPVKMKVSGIGVNDGAQFRPLTGNRYGLGTVFEQEIKLYNPTKNALLVEWIISSAPELKVKGLVFHETDVKVDLIFQAVAPHHNSSLASISFTASTSGHKVAYIFMSINGKYFVLPVEVMFHEYGIVPKKTFINFGSLYDPTDVIIYALTIENNSQENLELDRCEQESTGKALLTCSPGQLVFLGGFFDVGLLHITPRAEGDFEGKVYIYTTSKTPGAEVVVIHYSFRVFYGAILHRGRPFSFFKNRSSTNEFAFTSNYTMPVVMHDVQIYSPCYEVIGFQSGFTIQPGTPEVAFQIKYTPTHDNSCHSVFYVATSVNIMVVPLDCYDGLINYKICLDTDCDPKRQLDSFDYGYIGVNKTKSLYLEMKNSNPVQIIVSRLGTSNEAIVTSLKRVWNPSGQEVTSGPLGRIMIQDDTVTLDPDGRFQFEVHLRAPWFESWSVDDFFFKTVFESVYIPIKFQSVDGNFLSHPPVIKIEPTYPGLSIVKDLFVYNNHRVPVRLTGFKCNDSRVEIRIADLNLQPFTNQSIGVVRFAPHNVDPQFNYMDEFHSPVSLLSRSGEPLSSWDMKTYKRRHSIWNSIKEDGLDHIQATITFFTDLETSFDVSLQASLIFPSLKCDNGIVSREGVLEIGVSNFLHLRLCNPSAVPIHVQLVPPSQQLLSHFPELSYKFDPRFTIRQDINPGFVVPPFMMAEYGFVEFKSMTWDPAESVIFVKNNLTILDVVTLQVKLGVVKLLISDENAMYTNRLTFRLHTEGLREDCKVGAFLTRHIFVQNRGNATTIISFLKVQGHACSDGEFRVEPCHGFHLEPGATQKLSITFSPNFIHPVVHKNLLLMSVNGVTYNLQLEGIFPESVRFYCLTHRIVRIIGGTLNDVSHEISLAITVLFLGLMVWIIIKGALNEFDYRSTNQTSTEDVSPTTNSITKYRDGEHLKRGSYSKSSATSRKPKNQSLSQEPRKRLSNADRRPNASELTMKSQHQPGMKHGMYASPFAVSGSSIVRSPSSISSSKPGHSAPYSSQHAYSTQPRWDVPEHLSKPLPKSNWSSDSESSSTSDDSGSYSDTNDSHVRAVTSVRQRRGSGSKDAYKSPAIDSISLSADKQPRLMGMPTPQSPPFTLVRRRIPTKPLAQKKTEELVETTNEAPHEGKTQEIANMPMVTEDTDQVKIPEPTPEPPNELTRESTTPKPEPTLVHAAEEVLGPVVSPVRDAMASYTIMKGLVDIETDSEWTVDSDDGTAREGRSRSSRRHAPAFGAIGTRRMPRADEHQVQQPKKTFRDMGIQYSPPQQRITLAVEIVDQNPSKKANISRRNAAVQTPQQIRERPKQTHHSLFPAPNPSRRTSRPTQIPQTKSRRVANAAYAPRAVVAASPTMEESGSSFFAGFDAFAPPGPSLGSSLPGRLFSFPSSQEPVNMELEDHDEDPMTPWFGMENRTDFSSETSLFRGYESEQTPQRRTRYAPVKFDFLD